MSDLTKFSEGAAILQQVDVSDIFKNLAFGIAEAQQKLDDNSIAQAIKLAETQINGTSLLTLGFVPTFYTFHYADISTSIYLKMAQKESLEFGFGLDLQIAKDKGYSEDTHTFLSENSYSETTEEYKATRQLSFRAKEKKAVKINNKLVKQKEDLYSKSRLEKFKYDIEHEAGVDQVYDEIQSKKITSNTSHGVDVWMDGGFLRVEQALHFNKSGIGVLKVTDYADNNYDDIDVNGTATDGSFSLAADLEASLPLAATANTGTAPNTGKVYGLSKSGELYLLDGSNWVAISSKFYFAYNSDAINYSDNLKASSDPADTLLTHANITGFTNQNHDKHLLIHQALRLIQKNDPDVSIKITGMTDPKGGDNPKNQSLAKRRAERLKDHIFGSDALVNVEIGAVTNPSGGSDLFKRYATIELDADYILFVDGNITANATPLKSASVPNKFVYADDNNYGPYEDFFTASFTYGGASYSATDDIFEQVIAGLNITEHSYEKTSEGLHYYLADEAVVKLLLLTNQSEEIQIEYVGENNSSGTENSTTFLAGKTKNQKSLLNEAIGSKSQNSSFALGANMDFRMSRQFEMSMEGNSSMSARMVSLPAPTRFLEFLGETYGTGE